MRGSLSAACVTGLASLLCAIWAATLPALSWAQLPDGRVYEQVSPANKNGNTADGFANSTAKGPANAGYAVASGDGNGLIYEGGGGQGADAVSGAGVTYYTSEHVAGVGWQTRAAVPRWIGAQELQVQQLASLEPSPNLSRVIFTSHGTYVAEGDPSFSSNIYLEGSDPLVEPEWLGRPSPGVTPIPALGGQDADEEVGLNGSTLPAGPPADAGKLSYFAYSGTLVPEDATRAPLVGNGEDGAGIGIDGRKPWGFYQFREGKLSSAAILPADSPHPGEASPWGALPASLAGNEQNHFANLYSAIVPDHFNNEVSTDGESAVFVSPDPETEHPANEPPELYVRVNGERTVLVSQDDLLAPVNEMAAPAPSGVVDVADPYEDATGGEEPLHSYMYASADGSQVFFYSTDRLTEAAPENSEVKTYDFDVQNEALTYLPQVHGPILSGTADGARLAFEDTAGTTPELALWTAGVAGGTVTPIAKLPAPAPTFFTREGIKETPSDNRGELLIAPTRLSADGSVVVFQTDSPIGEGAFNNAGGWQEIYRYDGDSGELTCVSCAPVGVAPTGDAILSNPDYVEQAYRNGFWVDSRGISEDGSRVFFDTRTPLVAAATNGVDDVYEWEDGHIYLLSSGVNPLPSFFVDNSASGGDAFFATAAGLVPGDTDGSYDVYDARVPHPGDTVPPSAVPCEGDVCQGPPSVPNLLGSPTSATFSGPGSSQPGFQSESSPAPKTSKAKAKARRKHKQHREKRGKAPARSRKPASGGKRKRGK